MDDRIDNETADKLLLTVYDWALENVESDNVTTTEFSAAASFIRKRLKQLVLEGKTSEGDSRTVEYWCKVVFESSTGEAEAISPWEPNFIGLNAVWDWVSSQAEMVYGLTPMALRRDELRALSSTARVYMSRRQEGVAPMRVSFSYVESVPGLREGQMEKRTHTGTLLVWIARPPEALAFEKLEREGGSPYYMER